MFGKQQKKSQKETFLSTGSRENLFLLKELFKRERLPIIQQTEAAECGLASLAMVVNFYGHKIDLTTFRKKFSVSLKGASLRALMDMADQLDLASRPLRLEMEQMGELKTPAILHWDMDHFVVLKEVSKKGVEIHDPAQGIRFIPWKECSKYFTGVALELTPTNDFEKKEETIKMRLWDLWSRSIGFKTAIVQIFLLTIFLQIFALASPFYSQIVIDEVIGKHDLNLLKVLALGFGAITIINLVTSVLRRYILLYFGSMLSYQMTINLFRHLLKLPLDFFEKRHIGDVLSRFGSIGPIKEFLKSSLISSVIDGLMAVTTLILMFFYSPLLASVVLIVLLMYLSLRLAFYPIFKRKTQESIIAGAKERTNFIETLRGFMSLKLFAQEGDRQRDWQHKYADVINTNIQIAKLNILYDSANTVLFGLENILIFYLAAQMVIVGEFTLGMLVAFIAYKTQFVSRATNLVSIFIEFKMLSLHLERIADIAQNDIDRNLSLSETGQLLKKGSIELKNIDFRYADGEPLVINNLSLEIQPGSCVAITGPSGCGKTTLMKIALGLLTPEAGEVLFDGMPLKKISKNEFRKKVAAVMQDDHLFAGTIAENISFYDPILNQEKIEKCAKMAAIHEEISAMPMAYSSLVGDMGTVLSGGQKQRVLLARALYHNPEVLMMDEGSSHLDVKTEHQINVVIKKMKMTRIVVAHRSETIAMADMVYEFRPSGLKKIR